MKRKQILTNRGFTPFVPVTRPPPGSYDPTLDAQERASGRGLADFLQDSGKQTGRSANDYTLASGELKYNTGSSLADALLGGTRAQENTNLQTADLQRSYDRQASAQNQSANAAGVLEPGYLAAALAARQGNQAHDQAQIDLQGARAQADTQTATGRIQHAGATSQGRLDLGFTRGNEDLATAIERANREGQAFGQDVNDARWYQSQGVYDPPSKPANERTVGAGKTAVTYRRRPDGSVLLPNGRVLSQRGFQRFLQVRGLV